MTEEDLKLLAMAAQAAGMGCRVGPQPYFPCKYPLKLWNPILNEADRYALARALGLRIDFGECCVSSGEFGIEIVWGGEIDESHAVVLAAVEIWRKKNES